MNRVEISTVIPGSNNTNQLVEADIKIKSDNYKIFFRSEKPVLSENFEALLASVILPCMSVGGGKLIVEGELSQFLASRLAMIQDTYNLWDPSFHQVDIEKVKLVQRKAAPNYRIGTFFSGGVDSFYTLLKKQEEITDIIFIHGLDIQLEYKEYREKISKSVHEVAAHFGKNLIEIETNLRDFLDPFISYPKWGWSISLAAVGHLLYPNISRIYAPEGHTWLDIFPTGSRFLPFWNTEAFEFLIDGLEVSRVEKVSIMSKHDIILNNLRVCHRKPDSALNCCKCEKCIRTMINLKVNDVLKRSPAFEAEIDIKRVLRTNSIGDSKRSFIKQNLDALERKNGDKDLISALRVVLNRSQFLQRILKRLRKYRKAFRNIFG